MNSYQVPITILKPIQKSDGSYRFMPLFPKPDNTKSSVEDYQNKTTTTVFQVPDHLYVYKPLPYLFRVAATDVLRAAWPKLISKDF